MKWEHYALNCQRALYAKRNGILETKTKFYFIYRERIDGKWKYGFSDDACLYTKKRVTRILKDHLLFLEIGSVEYGEE